MRIRNFVVHCVLILPLSSMAWGAQQFRIEPGWSHVEFSLQNFGLHTVEGRFKVFSGIISYDAAEVTRSSVTVTVQPASIDTDIVKRDKHLQAADFFDVDHFPEITFHSDTITKRGNGYVMTGPLTIKGHTHPVELTFTYMLDQTTADKPTLHAEATGTINRHDFGIDYGSNFSVSKEIKITIHSQAIP